MLQRLELSQESPRNHSQIQLTHQLWLPHILPRPALMPTQQSLLILIILFILQAQEHLSIRYCFAPASVSARTVCFPTA